MTKAQAKARGFAAGEAAATHCVVSDMDRLEASCGCKAPAVCEECLMSAAWDSEINARSVSPFEVTASLINQSSNAVGLWTAYDDGVNEGVKSGSKRRLA